MKKIILALAIAGFFTKVQAQKLMTKNVPLAVTNAFSKAYPEIKDVEWSKDGINFEAEYDHDKVDRSVTFNAAGDILESEVKIKASELPAGVMEYVKKTYDEDEVREAARITDAKGLVTYEAEVKGNDLIFDSKGNFIKAIKK